ncbi:MAG: hypothetical protein CME67_06905 [Halobacteriovoraceae bacterium]|nr:hypothetical protein [Halobacteriovoraceae bacterium]|tara:strand:- start:566 stop:2947 length:2382 start_codon:yes stop_codon:yes gene_type:complete
MRSYLKIYLLFLIPSCLALSFGFYYSYEQEVGKTVGSFKEKYDRLTKVYADQIIEIEKSYEQLMRNSLLGIQQEIKSKDISKQGLQRVANKYRVSHLFLINSKGDFIKSTNEDPTKIPNLFTFSQDYKELKSEKGAYLTTPIIIPFPEKTPHKFLTIWTGKFFIEVGVQINDIAQNLSSILQRDENILRADLLIGKTPFSVKVKDEKAKDPLSFIKKIELKNPLFTQSLGEASHRHSLQFKVSRRELNKAISGIQHRYITNFFLTLGLIVLLLYLATRILRRTIKRITSNIFEMANEEDYNNNLRALTKNQDFEKLIQAINKLLKGYRQSSEESIKSERDQAYQSMARQVAHDIRSPLQALKSSKEELSSLHERDRLRLTTAINRIEEIAYNLLQFRGKKSQPESKEAVNIYTTVESIVIEKRMQYRESLDLHIENIIDPSLLGAFVSISQSTFKRILSNLITNSAEALEFKGSVQISAKRVNQSIEIEIADNGPGISEVIIDEVTKEGFTTKVDGCGLGLFHAKKEVESLGGRLKLKSNSKGTHVSLILPLSQTPSNFLTRLDLGNVTKVIVLDDDHTIHLIWKERLTNFSLKLEHFHSTKDLLACYNEVPRDALLLSDFELLGEELNGLDCIRFLSSPSRSILVTARSEESEIIVSAKKVGVKILPKVLANVVPVEQEALHKEIVLIDDDELVHLNWKRTLDKEGIKAHTYFSVESFLQESTFFSFTTPIYIDSNLSEGLRGEVLSRTIADEGFVNLHMATGYDPTSIEKPSWIKSIQGKSPTIAKVGGHA